LLAVVSWLRDYENHTAKKSLREESQPARLSSSVYKSHRPGRMESAGSLSITVVGNLTSVSFRTHTHTQTEFTWNARWRVRLQLLRQKSQSHQLITTVAIYHRDWAVIRVVTDKTTSRWWKRWTEPIPNHALVGCWERNNGPYRRDSLQIIFLRQLHLTDDMTVRGNSVELCPLGEQYHNSKKKDRW